MNKEENELETGKLARVFYSILHRKPDVTESKDGFRVQHMIALAQRAGLKTDFHYLPYVRGPCSCGVAASLYYTENRDDYFEEVRKRGDACLTVDELQAVLWLRKHFEAMILNYDFRMLECAGWVSYFLDDLHGQALIDEIQRRPSSFSEIEIKGMEVLLRELNPKIKNKKQK